MFSSYSQHNSQLIFPYLIFLLSHQSQWFFGVHDEDFSYVCRRTFRDYGMNELVGYYSYDDDGDYGKSIEGLCWDLYWLLATLYIA